MNVRPLGLYAFVGIATLAIALASLVQGAAQNIPPTPPPPVPANPTATGGVQFPLPSSAQPTLAPPAPTPTPSPARRGRRAAPSSSPSPSGSASGTPAPPQFTTLDGVWEVEVQMRAKTLYSHFSLKQSGQAGSEVTGLWDRGSNKKLPLNGTFDGRLFRFTASDGAAQYTFSGYIENFSDIVGMLNDGKTQIAFTAQHRKREKAF
jgi:hypothetical protein